MPWDDYLREPTQCEYRALDYELDGALPHALIRIAPDSVKGVANISGRRMRSAERL
jgi:hypothetical protein